jgi:MoaA/NifB/PqqE/SkfB family radical SAM enzyme
MTLLLAQVHVDVTRRCNLGCRYCPAPNAGQPRAEMGLDAFQTLAKNVFPWVRSVHFDGCGEPVLHPLLPEMIAEASGRGLEVELSTNGTLLSEPVVDGLVAAGLHRMNVSLDALEEDVLAALRPGIPHDVTMARLRALLARPRRPKVKLHVVLTRESIEHLARTVRAARGLGFDAMDAAIAYEMASDGAPGSALDELEGAEELLQAAKAEASADGFEVSHGSLRSRAAGGCGFRVDENCIVRIDGSVGPCCALFFEVPLRYRGITAWPDADARFGNALREDFRAIWDGERYVAFRDTLRTGGSPPGCLGCPAHYGVG